MKKVKLDEIKSKLEEARNLIEQIQELIKDEEEDYVEIKGLDTKSLKEIEKEIVELGSKKRKKDRK